MFPCSTELECVQVGVQKARHIAAQHGLKYVPIHHMEAHALIARAGTAVQFPYLCLLVSGGHNMIVIVEGIGAYTLLGATLDDAVGKRSSPPHDHRKPCLLKRADSLLEWACGWSCPQPYA